VRREREINLQGKVTKQIRWMKRVGSRGVRWGRPICGEPRRGILRRVNFKKRNWCVDRKRGRGQKEIKEAEENKKWTTSGVTEGEEVSEERGGGGG